MMAMTTNSSIKVNPLVSRRRKPAFPRKPRLMLE